MPLGDLRPHAIRDLDLEADVIQFEERLYLMLERPLRAFDGVQHAALIRMQRRLATINAALERRHQRRSAA